MRDHIILTFSKIRNRTATQKDLEKLLAEKEMEFSSLHSSYELQSRRLDEFQTLSNSEKQNLLERNSKLLLALEQTKQQLQKTTDTLREREEELAKNKSAAEVVQIKSVEVPEASASPSPVGSPLMQKYLNSPSKPGNALMEEMKQHFFAQYQGMPKKLLCC